MRVYFATILNLHFLEYHCIFQLAADKNKKKQIETSIFFNFRTKLIKVLQSKTNLNAFFRKYLVPVNFENYYC